MGKSRFIFNNLITSETMFTISSLRTGLVSAAVKEGTGSATINTSGSFTGTVDKQYTVEIDSIAGGAEVGQATFKWSDGSGSWNATGILTAATNTALNDGVLINFSTGSGADFVVGDKWWFIAWNLFNAGKMLDLDRDTRYRSATLEAPNTITIDLGSAQQIKALMIWDHNLTSGATITLRDSTSTFTEAVSWASEKILHYLSAAQTYENWVLEITDALNADGYIEIGELFLGSYLELSKNHKQGSDQSLLFIEDLYSTGFGIEKSRFRNMQKDIIIDFGLLPDADKSSIETMIDALVSRDTGIKKPFLWNEDSAYPGNSWLVDISGAKITRAASTNSYWDIFLTMKERLKSV